MRKTALLTAIALLLTAAPAMAGFPGDVPDKVQVTFGGLFATLDTQAGVGSVKGGVGATVVFENLFDIPVTNQVGFLTGSWRFSDRSYLDFGWLNIDRSAARDLREDATFQDYTILQGSRVTASFDSSFPYAAYRYDFLHLDQVKISGSAGISYMDLGAFLNVDGEFIPPGEVDPEQGTVDLGSSIQLPVPLLGMQLDWAISKRNSLVFYGRFIYVDYSGLRASISQQSFHWCYHPWKHFGFGAGVDKLQISIPEYEKDGKFATFIYNMSGLSIYGKASF